MEQLVFTPAAVLDLLSKIEELSEYDIHLDESGSDIRLQIGNSSYTLNTSDATDVEVDEEVVDQVDDINEDTYDDMEASGDLESLEPVESGVIKELAKTLLVGGLVRLADKLVRGKEKK